MQTQALRMAVACTALLSAVAHGQVPGSPMSQPVQGAYPMSQPIPGPYPMSQPPAAGYSSSPPMSSPMGVIDPAYGANPVYGLPTGQGEGQRKRAAFLGPLLMQLLPVIVTPMVQSFVESRRAVGAPQPEGRSLTEAYAMPRAAPGSDSSAVPMSAMPGQVSSPSMSSAPMASASSAVPMSTASSSPVPVARSSSAFEAGLAYEVFMIEPGGTESRISPSERTHRRGDQFYVRFMTNLPGQVVALNVDPAGRRTPVGEWSVEGGFPQRLPARGHFRFEGEEAGRELLEFQFTPCRSASVGRQRAIRVVDEAQTALRACSDALSTPHGARRMRAIVAVEDDKTAFATAPAAALSEEQSGLSVTLEFRRE
jgi:hypothetical protein